MNIKILKELSKQAETECGWSEEKFAELIVRECVVVGGTAFLNDNSKVPIFPAKQIRDHFGVEE